MLVATLSVTPGKASLELTLDVVNEGTEPVELTFRSGRRADFVALDDGKEVWRWSEGRMFTQALDEATLQPGESVSFDGSWDDPDPGEYLVRGTLASVTHEASAEMVVEI